MNNIDNELLMTRFKQSGFNYVELAEVIEISRNTIHNIMFGRTNPSYYVLTSLADALELTQDDIIAIFFPNIKFKKGLDHDELTY